MVRIEYEFKLWQQSEIYTKNFSYIQIYDCIKLFVNEGIVPFVNNHGYTFFCNKNYICDAIATSLFYYTKNNHYLIPISKNIKFNDEFYDYYTQVISREEWENFWNYYNNLFNNLFFFKEGGFCVQLEHLMFSFIDLDKSPIHIKYIQENIESDTEDETSNIDPYILDQRNRENHYKFTKFES